MHEYLNKYEEIPFHKIFLDPNNPRTAPQERPGYEDPQLIFPDAVQGPLLTNMEALSEVANLEPAIISQGWIPVDPMLVWEHPKHKKHYIVIEGNTRTTVLRRIRRKLPLELERLEKMEKKSKSYDKQEIENQKRLIAVLKGIIADTENLIAFPIKAASAAELEERLPHLHGVRHINHAQHWSPYAKNLYVLSRYRQVFEEQYGEGKDLRIEPALIKKVADSMSLGATEARRNVQAASAFSHFKRNYEDRMPAGDRLTDEDHYFFEEILKNEFPRTKFGFDKADLHLSPEMEEVLFKWAFAVARPKGQPDVENPNKFYKAEAVRVWQRIHRYDTKAATKFAERFDVDEPDSAPTMAELEIEYGQHKNQVSPLFTISSLLTGLKKLNMETLMSQATSLRPMIEEMIEQGRTYLKVIEAVAVEPAGKK